jgi:hypothetical protein
MNVSFRDPNTLEADDYVRMPKPKRRFLGMSRTTLQQLGDAGLIEVIAVQRPGLTRGLKLIFLPSLYRYLDGLRTAQAAKNANQSATNTTSQMTSTS